MADHLEEQGVMGYYGFTHTTRIPSVSLLACVGVHGWL
jgi:hypothetical protein